MSHSVKNNDKDYNFSARQLHRIALAWPGIARASFDFELGFNKSKPAAAQPVEQRHVFVAGLARAGTTILLHAIHQSGAFRSLTYRDMPFVLMPVMWQRLSGRDRKQGARRERAHGDRIEVDYDSPEAFEEVFWRVFSGSEYIKPNCLEEYKVSTETIGFFRQYIAQVVASAESPMQTRYLSKNNNNVLRLPAISASFPEAAIVIPFRHPLQQADSLWNQHRRFIERHRQDRFAYSYMRWLGHHEFGATHKPFRFSDSGEPDRTLADTDNLNYWLQQWLHTYTHVLHKRPARSLLVCYEDLCNNPDACLSRIHAEVGLPFSLNNSGVEFAEARRAITSDADVALKNRALELFAELRAQQAL